jgi:hypothetical protein
MHVILLDNGMITLDPTLALKIRGLQLNTITKNISPHQKSRMSY